MLEEDIAQANVGLDLLGQARLWLGYAGEVEGAGRDEDALAFRRDAPQFRNLLLVEQPNGNFADTIARQFLFDAWHVLDAAAPWQRRSDARIAEIAVRSAKEAAYHVERSGDWVIRLGDGTDVSHERMQAAIDVLWMYTGEMFAVDAIDEALIGAGIAADPRVLETSWRAHVDADLRRGDARARRPAASCRAPPDAAGGRACTPSISGTCCRRCSTCSARIRRRDGDRRAARRRGGAGRRRRRATAGCARRWPSLWRALDAVPDPEIPVVSVHELGMVRGVEWDEADPDDARRAPDADVFRLPRDRGHPHEPSSRR